MTYKEMLSEFDERWPYIDGNTAHIREFILSHSLTRVQQRKDRLARNKEKNPTCGCSHCDSSRKEALSEELSQAREEEQELLKLLA